jgi:hypothetical protein
VTNIHPSITFVGKAGVDPIFKMSSISLKCQIRVKVRNTLAYYDTELCTAVKSFTLQRPGLNATKLFTAIIY